MARNGSGTFSLLAVTAPANTVSSSTTVNNNLNDIATALTESINKDGTKAWAANQSVGSNKFTSLADGSARTDSINMGQVQDGKANWVAAGGTADVITATYSPAITALVDGQLCYVRATAANTVTTPTFAPNGLTARTIVKNGGVALAVGDIVGDGHELILRYLLASTRWELLNPGTTTAATASLAGAVELATTTETLTGTDATRAVTPDSLAAIWEAGADITDGAAITIGEGGYFNLITSTTAITSFSITTDKAGRSFHVRFDTARTLTHNATSLILPGAANITTIAGDIAFVRSLGSGNVIVEQYIRGATAPQTSGTFTPTLELGGAAVGMTFSYRAGNYTKIGNIVTIWIDILLTAEGSSTGSATITGLPFAMAAGNGAVAPVFTSGMSSPDDGVTALLAASASSISLWIGSATGNAALTNTHTGNSSRFIITMTYFT